MNLSFDINANIFIVRNTVYNDRTVLGKLGFKWDGTTKTWSSSRIEKAVALYSCADDDAKKVLDVHSSACGKNIEELKDLAIQPEWFVLLRKGTPFT